MHKAQYLKLVVDGAGETLPRAIGGRGKVADGEILCEVAVLLRPVDRSGVVVVFDGGRGQARVWASAEADCPSGTPTSMSRALAGDQLVKAGAGLAELPVKPVLLRGQWGGVLALANGKPTITLARKITPYATFVVESGPKGWRWRYEGEERWFSEMKKTEGSTAHPTLAAALDEGLRQARPLVGEACSFRDTHRRGAVDKAWGAQHPVKAPKDKGADKRAAGRAAKPKGEDCACKLPNKEKAPAAPPAPPAVAKTEQQLMAAAAAVSAGASELEAQPELARARRLLASATKLIESPRCAGEQKDKAVAALTKANQSFADASAALGAQKGSKAEGARLLKKTAEHVARAASNVARACAAGKADPKLGKRPRDVKRPSTVPLVDPAAAKKAKKVDAAKATAAPRASQLKAKSQRPKKGVETVSTEESQALMAAIGAAMKKIPREILAGHAP